MVQCHSTQCDSILECEVCELVDISSPTSGGVLSTYNVMEMWVAFNNCRTDVDNKQCPRCPSIFTTMRQCGSYRCPEWHSHDLDRSLGDAHSILHNQLDWREVCACWVPKNPTDNHKTYHMGPLLHLTPYTAQRDLFLQCLVIVDEMWVYHTSATKEYL